jgi:hypothetical protein
VNCAECGHPAAVLHGDVPMCGTCFYKNSVTHVEPVNSDDIPHSDAMWRRLADAIASLETIASRIAAEMNELVKSRGGKDSEKQ